jgi:hypothetical protein
MLALVYRNTQFNIPHWIPFNEKEPRGISYELATHFVHFYGKDVGLHVISPGLTVTEAKGGGLDDWVQTVFGGADVSSTINKPGHTIEGVWRPGLYFDDEIVQGLGTTLAEVRLAEQSLLLLVQRLDDLLLFVEPSQQNLTVHSHKARELLILACTDVESYWKHYLRRAGVAEPPKGYTTNQYVRLKAPLFLGEYEIKMPRYAAIPALRPFLQWSTASPTVSLDWYDAYNKTKHDRATQFEAANLLNCIKATAANIILFAVRFGPFRLHQGAGTLAAFFNQTFSIELNTPNYASFYAPLVSLPLDQRSDRICFNSKGLIQPWTVLPFRC